MSNQGISVMIVDDNQDDVDTYCRYLSTANGIKKIITAENGQEAVNRFENNPTDIILIDYRMPGWDGLRTIDEFRKRNYMAPVIMLTGNGDEELAVKAFKHGAMDYISINRVNDDSIRRVVFQVLEKSELRIKLEEQKKNLENFSYILAHDLQAPIRHIQILSTMLNEAVENENLESLPSLSKTMSLVAARMSALIVSLDEYNKINAQVDMSSVDMNQAANDANILLKVPIEEKKAKVTLDHLPIVHGHSPFLIQLLSNLISNGIKYCDKATPEIHISAEPHSEGWVIMVKDNGIGIPEKFFTHIFEPFKRLHGNEENYQGSGLGLAICRKIVDIHGGHIWCQSEMGHGTTFLFTLPRAVTH